MTFEESWTKAERTCFNRLLTETKCRENVNAMLGPIGFDANTWAFTTGGGVHQESIWCKTITALWLNADLLGQFSRREDAQKFAMYCLNAQINDGVKDGNVVCFRVREGGMPTINLEAVQLANTDKQMALYVVRMGMELVFHCVGETT